MARPTPEAALLRAARTGDLRGVAQALSGGSGPDQPAADGRTALFLATEGGHAEIVVALLQAGADPLAHAPRHDPLVAEKPLVTGGRGRSTLLHVAAAHDAVSVIDVLLQRGFVLDARDRDLVTPAGIAAARRADSALTRLLDRGADPDARDIAGNVPLVLAGAGSTVEILLSAGADPQGAAGTARPPLCRHVARGDVRAVRALLDAGAAVEAEEGGASALALAAAGGRQELVELLLARGAQVAGRPPDTPLARAARRDHRLVVQRLLSAGAQVAPFVIAAAAGAGSMDVLRFLLEHELPGGPEVLGAALHEAARADRQDALVLLLAAGAPVDARAADGATALHAAAIADARAAVRVLLAAGASPAAVDHGGYTASRRAEAAGHEELAWNIRPPTSARTALEARRPLGPGDRVRHARFGEGEVVAVTGTAPDLRIKVRFGEDEKQMLVSVLERIT